MMRPRALWIALVASVVGCARQVPPAAPAAALYRDLQRLVTVAQAGEWKVDRTELDNLEDDALLSVCGTDPLTREILRRWLDQRIAARGGDPETLFRKGGSRDIDDAKPTLELSRIRMLLDSAERGIDECPFWIAVDPNFRGRQISDDRWQLSIAGGGRGNLLFEEGNSDLSFGGAGRLALGRALGTRWALYGGAEFGGQASFPKEDGERASVVLELELGLPIVMRYRLVNSFVEAELGYLASFAEDDDDVAQGFRVGATIGARALLTRWFFPGAAFQLLYDRIDGGRLDSPRHTFRLGFRVVFDLNLD